MARKRKNKVTVIVLDTEFSESELKPKCFGHKEAYCRPELCGDWYNKCKGEEDDKRID